MSRTRRHHNTKGFRQIRKGRTREQVRRIARKLQIQFEVAPEMAPVPVINPEARQGRLFLV